MSEQQKSITIVSPIPLEDVKNWLAYSVKKENTTRAIFCIHQNSKITLTTRLYYVDTGDCGRGYEYKFALFLHKGESLVFDSDPLYDEKQVIEAFTTFAGDNEDVQFYVATTKEDKS